MQTFRYSRWDGSQQLALDADQVLSELADDLLDHGDLRRALQRLMQRGMQTQPLPGLQDLLRRLRERQQRTLNQYNLDSIIDDLQKRLEEILETERHGIERRLQETRDRVPRTGDQGDPQGNPQGADQDQGSDQGQDGDQGMPRGPQAGGQRPQGQQGQQAPAGQRSPRRGQSGGQQGPPEPGSQGEAGEPADAGAFSQEMAEQMMQFLERLAEEKQQYLDQLPQDPAGQIQRLQNYEFMDPEAKRKFDELMEMLKQQVMDSLFQNMMQGMQGMTPEQMEHLKEMLRQLNRMLKDRLQGKEPNFQEFMEQFGDMFPGNPQNLDELLEQMQAQMQAMQSLLQSMSQAQRQQLSEVMEQLMQDMGLRQQLMEMSLALDQLFPQERPERYPFRGDDPVSLQEAMRLMEELRELAELEQAVRAAQQRGEIERIDTEQVRDLLGEEDAQNLERLKQIEKLLEEAGYLKRNGNRLELTARAMRKIGQKSLQDIFAQLKKDRFGNHSLDRRGAGRERTDDTKRYEYGDPFFLDLEETLMNALQREGVGTPIKLAPDDFEVYRTEHLTQASTVLMLDLSRSMGLTGRFPAAKKVALALSSLIKTQFPRDQLYIVGFSEYAQELKGDGLQLVNWNHWVSGTNMHHAFMMSRRLLSQHKGGTRQIIMITDGEPTAHLERGYAYFEYPPSLITIRETLKEVQRCTREGITINTFMLERTPYLMEFVQQMAKINRGRVFYTSPDRLGEYILVDYLSHKRRKIS
ncbi:MAG: VWA domain-containing protein [Chloroflexi bacterium]|nr:VWA domain-containing protein [Chloroflexota bacterium]